MRALVDNLSGTDPKYGDAYASANTIYKQSVTDASKWADETLEKPLPLKVLPLGGDRGSD